MSAETFAAIAACHRDLADLYQDLAGADLFAGRVVMEVPEGALVDAVPGVDVVEKKPKGAKAERTKPTKPERTFEDLQKEALGIAKDLLGADRVDELKGFLKVRGRARISNCDQGELEAFIEQYS